MKRLCTLILTLQILLVSAGTAYAGETSGDEFDSLREKWTEVLTGGDYPESGEVYTNYILPKINELDSSARSMWNSMVKKDDRVNDYAGSYLWSNALMGDTRDIYSRNSSRFSITYARLATMATAYRTKGSALEGNRELLNDIIDALDWMYQYKFNESTPRNNRDSAASNDNWYHWEISGPAHLNNIQALLYEELTETQIANYQKAIDHQVSSIGSGLTGANRLSVCLYFAVGGIVKKDADKLKYARDAVSPALEYVAVDDGFYRDGSFIQHHTVPYNGGYGLTALENLSDVMYLFENSSFRLTDPNASNIYEWIDNSFLTTVYEGRTMDSVRGRAIAGSQRPYTFIRSLTKTAFFAPEEKAAKYKSYIKRCYENNLSYDFYSDLGNIFSIAKFYDIVNDESVAAAGEQTFYKQFYGMDRFVHFRPGFSFNASMHSDRIRNYESINNENLKGWHTGDGMTYLYNSDLMQYDGGFWATVDKYRLPGTTVVKNTDAKPDTFGDSFAGGADGGEIYGVSGMQYKAGVDSSGGTHTLSAKKSWFMFDDEIVALGSDISSSTDGDDTETIVENRKINSSGNNKLTVEGVSQPVNTGWSKNFDNVSWVHLEGNPSLTKEKTSTDIGYYFPDAISVSALRETRTDSFKSMSASESSKKYTNNYLSLGINHGVKPQGESYSYVLLPGKTAEEVGAYSENPDIEIIANNREVQAVRDNKAQAFGANFWSDNTVTAGEITCSGKASVMVTETEKTVELSVSDPTQLNSSVIELSFGRGLGGIISMDSEIAAEKTENSVNISVNVKNSKGKTFHIKFSKDSSAVGPAAPVIKSAEALSVSSARITWEKSEGATGYKVMRSRSKDGGYASLSDEDSETLSYTDTGLGSGIKYYYKVAAMNDNGISDYSEAALVQTVPESPFEIYADGFSGSTKISWREVEGADYYNVFRSENKTSGYECITPNGCYNTSFTDPTAEKTVNYYYKVQSLNRGGISEFSETAASMYGRKGIIIQDNFDNFTTGKLSGEYGWYADVDPDWKNKAEIIALSDSDKALRISRNVGTLKGGAVRPFEAPAGSIVTAEVTIKPEAPTGDYKTVMLITDAASSGKSMIHAFCQNGSLVVYNSSSRKTVIDGTFDYSKTYVLKAVINTNTKKFDFYVDGVMVASGFSYRDSSAGSVPKCLGFSTGNVMNIMTIYKVSVSYTFPTVTGINLIRLSATSNKLSYNAVSGIDKYAVFKADSADGRYRLVYCGSNTSFVDSKPIPGTINYYRVAAVCGNYVSELSAKAEMICDINGIYFSSGGIYRGTEKLSGVPNEVGSYTIKAAYTASKAASCTYNLAIYADGILVGIVSEKKSFYAGEAYTFTKEINISDDMTGKNVTVRCYLWDGTSKLIPLTAFYEIY